jgi:hypothetical protein
VCVFIKTNEIYLNFQSPHDDVACCLALEEIKDLRDELTRAINTIETGGVEETKHFWENYSEED